jgi:large subunit ribosomal protein L18
MQKQLLTQKKKRVRAGMTGTAARPRLSVFKSSRFIYAQLIDDKTGKTLAAASDVKNKSVAKVPSAHSVGAKIAEAAKLKKIKTVIFDRGGFRYHGRIKAVAEGAREAGLEF